MLQFSVQITLAGQLSLSFAASSYFAFGPHGEALVDSGVEFYKYKFDGSTYKLQWKKPLPSGIKGSCQKLMSEHGQLFLRNYENDPTFRFSSDLEPLSTSKHDGYLTACLAPESLVYCQKKKKLIGKDYWTLRVVRCDKELTLQPPKGSRWGECLSVCSSKNTIAVVDYDTETLDIFNQEGNLNLFKMFFVQNITKMSFIMFNIYLFDIEMLLVSDSIGHHSD